mmetsp:Transcript_49843/g.140512  ORF Transcript_49843/g.140512 Transcript_49843/m.140512 type:complete len:205 (-) Transcript_49843:101-715(-)
MQAGPNVLRQDELEPVRTTALDVAPDLSQYVLNLAAGQEGPRRRTIADGVAERSAHLVHGAFDELEAAGLGLPTPTPVLHEPYGEELAAQRPVLRLDVALRRLLITAARGRNWEALGDRVRHLEEAAILLGIGLPGPRKKGALDVRRAARHLGVGRQRGALGEVLGLEQNRGLGRFISGCSATAITFTVVMLCWDQHSEGSNDT